jgi:hypothetical protein
MVSELIGFKLLLEENDLGGSFKGWRLLGDFIFYKQRNWNSCWRLK